MTQRSHAFLRRLRRRCVTVEDVGRLETRRIRPSLCPTVDAAAVFCANSDVNAANCARVHEHAKMGEKECFSNVLCPRAQAWHARQ